MLLDSAGRPIRRAIGFLAEYRVERDEPAEGLELVDAIGSDKIDAGDDVTEISFDD